MPGRRPYASRGVPRRATTRRSGESSYAGVAALIGVISVATAFLLWLIHPFSGGDSRVAEVGSNGVAASSSNLSPSDVAGVLQMSNVSAPTPGQTPLVGSTPPLTTRRWNPGS